MPPRRCCCALRLALLLAALLAAAVHAGPKEGRPPALGASLAGVRLFDLLGRRHDLGDVSAKRVVVIYWAYWCDTWKKALPELASLAADREELGCEVWAVSVDGRWTAQIRPLLAARRVPFPLLLDDGKLARRLGIRRVPTVMVLDSRRRAVWVREGYPGNAALERAIRGADGPAGKP